MAHRIGQYLQDDIRRATVFVRLRDEDGDMKKVTFQFDGETFDDGEHCKLYMREQAFEDYTMVADIEALDNPHTFEDGRRVYRFHKEEVHVESEEHIHFANQWRR